MSRLAWQIAAMIKITDRVCIPFDEIRFITSRSSGPGGQHVNTADTRVTLLFDVEKTVQKKNLIKELIYRQY